MEPVIEKMSRIVMPGDVNYAGNLYGGKILDWMDELSGIAAKRFSHSEIVTVGIESVSFKCPIPKGSFVDVKAEVVHVGNTSMKIKVTIEIDQDFGDEKLQAAEAYFSFVAVDENGKPHRIQRKIEDKTE